jgi:leucyl aminopeptidase
MKNQLLLYSFLIFPLTTYAQEKDGFIYAKMQTENAQLLKNEVPDSIQILSSKDNLSVINFHPILAEKLHDKLGHGHGYIYQASKEAAISSLYSERVSKKTSAYNYTISENAFVNTILKDVDENEIEKNILLLESFKTRFHTRQEANDAVFKMKEVWENLITLYNRTDISVKVVDHISTPMKSLVLTINGNEYADEYVIIGGHIDSIAGWDLDSQSNAPGADDNASGIATITEVLRVLLKNNFKPQRTVEIMAYAAEEVGLRGSKEIAKKYRNDTKNVIGYVQFDMTNYKGSTEDIFIYTDSYTSSELNNFLMQLMDTYNTSGLHQFTYSTSECGYGCSDHASWADFGYRAALPFEAKFRENNSSIHTVNDTYSNLGNSCTHAAKFTKLGIEYVVEAAKQSNILATEEIKNSSNNIFVSNKVLHYKFNTNQSISFYIVDATGKRVKSKSKKLSNGTVDLTNLNNGFYIVIFEIGNGKTISHKFVIK